MHVKDPARTRNAILDAGYLQLQHVGVRAARVETILSGTAVTKGAFYHHFPTKRALTEAVIDEIVGPEIAVRWIDPIETAADPIDGLQRAVLALASDERDAALLAGCPLGNLLHDLRAPGPDAGIRERLLRVLATWRRAWAAALARGQANDVVRRDLHPDVTAAFLISTYHGLAATSRAEAAPATARRLLRTYATLIETLGAG